jgi:CDP-diacylglycerol pyrophosphatase
MAKPHSKLSPGLIERSAARIKAASRAAATLALALGLIVGSTGANAAPSAATAPPAHHHASSDVLWHIVHDRCMPHQAQGHEAAPCAYVSPPGQPWGYALLKDLAGAAQFLMIPTERITGIESPVLLQPGSARYWAAAWDGRRWLEQRMGGKAPRDGIGLAINSALGRSQNQLHIHIDCVRPDVRQMLKAHGEDAGTGWVRLALPPNGHDYEVHKIDAADLDTTVNPFILVADQGPDVSGNMGIQTIAVVGATFRNGHQGFYLLSDHAAIATRDAGAAEELLDQSCQVAR